MKSVLTAENLLYMFNGMKLTLAIAACASVIAILFGTLLALAKTYCKGKLGFLNLLATIYVEIFRCTPQLLWILMFRFFVKGGGFNLGVMYPTDSLRQVIPRATASLKYCSLSFFRRPFGQ